MADDYKIPIETRSVATSSEGTWMSSDDTDKLQRYADTLVLDQPVPSKLWSRLTPEQRAQVQEIYSRRFDELYKRMASGESER